MPVCTVTGTLRDGQGVALPDTLATFVPIFSVFVQDASLPTPERSSAISDALGEISISLVPGNYTVRTVVDGDISQFSIGVPNATAADIADLTGGTVAIVPGPATPDASDAAAEAAASAAAAEADAIAAAADAAAAAIDAAFVEANADAMVIIYATKALADAGLAAIAADMAVEVSVDESRNDGRTRYRKTGGVYVFELDLTGPASLGYPDALVEAYSGTGTATTGAPRLFLGGNTSSGDDSAILVGRDVVGAGLYSHAFRDESTFTSTGAGSSYTPFDAACKIEGATAYGHTRGFQFRNEFAGSGTIDEIAGFIAQPIVSGTGTAANMYGLKVDDVSVTGAGGVTNYYGIWISDLTEAASAKFAIYVAGDNPSYFGGNIQIAGTTQLQDGVVVTYSDNAFGRGATFRNTNAGNSAISGVSVLSSGGDTKGVLEYYSSGYANPALADTTVIGSFGSAKVQITASVDGSSTPDIVFQSGANPVALTIAGSTNSATFAGPIRNGGANIVWATGTGSPEGVVSGLVGSIYSRTDGGAGTSLYVKESGTGNTGWVSK